MCASARHVRLRGDRVPSNGHRACRCARDVQDDGALGCVDYGACDSGSREESAGAAAALRDVLCAVRCACRASACVRLVFDACCRKRWLILRCASLHSSGCIKRATAFILVCRLLLPPALQADPKFVTLQKVETALQCFAI